MRRLRICGISIPVLELEMASNLLWLLSRNIWFFAIVESTISSFYYSIKQHLHSTGLVNAQVGEFLLAITQYQKRVLRAPLFNPLISVRGDDDGEAGSDVICCYAFWLYRDRTLKTKRGVRLVKRSAKITPLLKTPMASKNQLWTRNCKLSKRIGFSKRWGGGFLEGKKGIRKEGHSYFSDSVMLKRFRKEEWEGGWRLKTLIEEREGF